MPKHIMKEEHLETLLENIKGKQMFSGDGFPTVTRDLLRLRRAVKDYLICYIKFHQTPFFRVLRRFRYRQEMKDKIIILLQYLNINIKQRAWNHNCDVEIVPMNCEQKISEEKEKNNDY